MANLSGEIKIKILDYYPQIEKIPYDDYDCIISDKIDNLVIPLAEIGQKFFVKKYNKIETDLIYLIEVIDRRNNLIISNSTLIIPFMKILPIVRMNTIRYEQYIKLFLEGNIKDKILGFLFSGKNLYLKIAVEINLINNQNKSKIFNNIKTIRNSKSKNKINKNDFISDISGNLYNISNIKNIQNKKNQKLFQSILLSRNYEINKSIELYKSNKKKSYSYSNKFPIKNNSLNKKEHKRNNSNDPIYIQNNKNIKLYEYQNSNKKSIKQKKAISKLWYKTPYKNIINKTTPKENTQKKIIRKINSLKSNKSKNNSNKNINIEIKKNKTCYKIFPKGNTNPTNKNIKNNNNLNLNSKIPTSLKKSKKNISKLIPNSNKKPKINDYKIKIQKKIDFKNNNNINFNFIRIINTQEELKNNLITTFDYFKSKIDEFKKKFGKNLNNQQMKYLLCREKNFLENNKQHRLINRIYKKDIKNFIHVKINTQYNNLFFNKMLSIKKKEFNIINLILINKVQLKNDPKKILQEKLKQQKQIHVLLNLIRVLIKNYGNLSHLYEDDNNKKILLKSLFLRYNIREKEWNNNDLLDIYNKINNDIKIKNNKKVIKEIKQEKFKAIKEEEEEEIEESKEEIKNNDNNNNNDNDSDKILNNKINNNDGSEIIDNNNDNNSETNNEESLEVDNNDSKYINNINEGKEIEKIYSKDINEDAEENKENKVINDERTINNLNVDLKDKKDLNNKKIIINNFIISKK